jgi:hypothetical protein
MSARTTHAMMTRVDNPRPMLISPQDQAGSFHAAGARCLLHRAQDLLEARTCKSN